MNPTDIPTTITRLIYDDPIHRGQLKISQNDIARSLAHYWPAIEQHIRRQIADEIDADMMGNRTIGRRRVLGIVRGDIYQPIATDITPDDDARQQNNHDAYTL